MSVARRGDRAVMRSGITVASMQAARVSLGGQRVRNLPKIYALSSM
jgi:hypothetical protein